MPDPITDLIALRETLKPLPTVCEVLGLESALRLAYDRIIKEGYSLWEAAKSIGFPSDIRLLSKYLIKKYGNLPQLRVRKLRFPVDTAMELYLIGLTIEEIADYYNVSGSEISYELSNNPEYLGRDRIRKFDREEAFRLFREGLTFKQIGDCLGVTPGALHRVIREMPDYTEILQSFSDTKFKHFRDAGVAYKGQRRRKKFSRDEALRLYNKGFSVQNITDHYGLKSTSSVHKALKQTMGYVARSTGRTRKFSYEEAFRLYHDEKWTLQQIADHFGVTSGAISMGLGKTPGYKEIAASKRPKMFNRTEAFQLYRDEKWTLQQIADHYGVTPSPVSRALQKISGYKEIAESRRLFAANMSS